jgi:hypothetical protein
MKFLLSLIIILTFFLAGHAQELSPRQKLLSSKGNIDVSARFKEAPVLAVDERDAEIYRITIIPTFYNPIKIRIEKRGSDYVLISKRLSGQGGYDAGRLKTEKRRHLRLEDWERFTDLLREAEFLEMAFPNEKGEMTICLDGSEWTLEGVKNGKYHVVNRYCPEVKAFQAIGLYLVERSGLRLKERELY